MKFICTRKVEQFRIVTASLMKQSVTTLVATNHCAVIKISDLKTHHSLNSLEVFRKIKSWISFHTDLVFGLRFSLIQMPLFGRRISSPVIPRSSGFWHESTQKRRRIRARRAFSSICAKRWPRSYRAEKKMLLSGCIISCCICMLTVTALSHTKQQGLSICLENRTAFRPKSRSEGHHWNQHFSQQDNSGLPGTIHSISSFP